MLGAMSVAGQAQVMIDRKGNTYLPLDNNGGVRVGVDPTTGMPATGYIPMVRESDPSMFNQVRRDGSIVGSDDQN
jgi:hypothetical protein